MGEHKAQKGVGMGIDMRLKDYGNGTFSYGEYTLSNMTQAGFIACYMENVIGDSDIFWKSSLNPMVKSVPMFTIQILIIIVINRLLTLILRYLHQPRFVCEMLSGIVVSPPILGRISAISEHVNPIKGNLILETMGNFGLVFYVFLLGLEMDITSIKGIQKKAVKIAMAGVLPPLFIGSGLFYLMQKESLYKIKTSRERVAAMLDATKGALFFGISLSVTSFPDLARVLSDLKILHTDVGRMALSAGRINDLSSWALLVVVLAIVNGKDKYYFVLFTFIFLIFCWYGLRPVLSWLIRRTSKDGKFSDFHFHFIIAGVMACAFITDALGSQSLVGALMFGIIMPNEELGLQILNRFENFVSLILMPAFFMISGLRTDLAFNFFGKANGAPVIAFVVVLASTAKFISTFLVSYFNRMPARDAMAIGLLISTKGVLSLIIINAGRNLQRLTIEEFTTMAIAIIITTGAVKPIMLTFYNSSKRLKHNKNRTMEGSGPDSDLRILACVHSNRNVSGIINLLEACNPTKKSPICVFAAHLLELTSRAAARLIVHGTDKNVGQFGREREGGESEQIISAFKAYESDKEGAVFVQPLTAVSPFISIHEDICGLAEDKHVTLILVPFHKLASTDGLLQEGNSSIRSINQNLLVTERCSIGILVDRGFGSAVRGESDRGGSPQRRIAMIFIGGPDDREALAYAWRMAGYPSTELVVVRFVPTKDTASPPTKDDVTLQDMKKSDDDCINKFRFRTMSNPNIKYVERQSSSGEETVTTIRTMFNDYEMYIVGRGQGSASPLTSGLSDSDWNDCAELGPIGDSIVSLAEQSTVLVIQQRAPPVDKSALRFGDRLN
ncbi:Cation proton exchanger [Tripterygium wilfordii]|uniref:Cation proton exchanger n=1 Tax=Tripterygium wilfordii TaxID=458696 RepID=A0A7J7DJ71_TRIWF|nr:Cation proton exchanger [Tripterygium wilfordii]